MKAPLLSRLKAPSWRSLRFWNNPMLSKELRSRMRGWRAPVTVSAYLALLGGIGCAYFLLQSYQARYGGIGPQIGLQMFAILSMFQLLLVAFITPAFTVGSISGEKERQTFDLLMCTPLSPAAIVFGKLFSGTAYSLLLMVAGLPLLSVVFLFGGISLGSLATTFLVLIVTALTFAVIGLFCSALFRRSQISTIVSYAAVFFLIIGISIIAAFLQSWKDGRGYYSGMPIPSVLQYINPLVALSSAIMGDFGGPIAMPYMSMLQLPSIYRTPLSFYKSNGVKLTWFQTWLVQTPPWVITVIFDLLLIVVLLAITVRLVKPTRGSPFAALRRLLARLPFPRRKREVSA